MHSTSLLLLLSSSNSYTVAGLSSTSTSSFSTDLWGGNERGGKGCEGEKGGRRCEGERGMRGRGCEGEKGGRCEGEGCEV